jgi:hypothetical protein
MDARQNAKNCEELAKDAHGPTRKRLKRMAEGWRDVADVQDWLDGREPHEEDPRETPLDDPRQRTDWPNTKQTDEPWKGNPEKEQLNPNRPDIDLEKWQESSTH